MNFKLFLLLQKDKVCILFRNAQHKKFLINFVGLVTKGEYILEIKHQYVVTASLDDAL